MYLKSEVEGIKSEIKIRRRRKKKECKRKGRNIGGEKQMRVEVRLGMIVDIKMGSTMCRNKI